MKKLLKDNWLYIAGAILGGAGGYLYWFYIGCSSGTCAITSKPLNSTIYFAVFGSIALGMLKPAKKQTNNNNETSTIH